MLQLLTRQMVPLLGSAQHKGFSTLVYNKSLNPVEKPQQIQQKPQRTKKPRSPPSTQNQIINASKDTQTTTAFRC